jgi:hypothetical protein
MTAIISASLLSSPFCWLMTVADEIIDGAIVNVWIRDWRTEDWVRREMVDQRIRVQKDVVLEREIGKCH